MLTSPSPPTRASQLARRGATRPATVLCAAAAALLAGATIVHAAPKTDILLLVNGDIVTGEIKYLQQGLLTYKTDSMGTLNVEWGEVQRLTSVHFFQITLGTGERIFGSFLPGAGLDTVSIGVTEAARLVPVREVVHVVSLKDRFWSRFDGSLDIGISYTKSTRVTEFSVSSHTEFKALKDRVALDLATLQSKTGDEAASVRRSASLGYARIMTGRWYVGVSGGGERNDELGIAARISGGLGSGYYLVQTSSMELGALGGVLVNTERATGSDIYEENLEALLSASYSVFRYNTPKTSIKFNSSGYANLNRGPRFRLELNLSGAYEVVTDFTLKLTFYEQVDSSPPSAAAAFNDYSFIFSLGWTY